MILFEHEEENDLKPTTLSNFWCSNYIEYEGNGDRNKNYQLRNIFIKLHHI